MTVFVKANDGCHDTSFMTAFVKADDGCHDKSSSYLFMTVFIKAKVSSIQFRLNLTFHIITSQNLHIEFSGM
tara:strand:- start:1482 stop:1697 length:216 start_codon:yes stop_codon:yes gene_type:complete